MNHRPHDHRPKTMSYAIQIEREYRRMNTTYTCVCIHVITFKCRAATIIRPLLVLNYGYFEPHQADGNETLKVRFFYIDRPGFNSILVGKFVVLSNS